MSVFFHCEACGVERKGLRVFADIADPNNASFLFPPPQGWYANEAGSTVCSVQCAALMASRVEPTTLLGPRLVKTE